MPATTGPRCSATAPTAPYSWRPSASTARRAAIDADSVSIRSAVPDRRRRHDLSVRRRRRRDGRVTDPVERARGSELPVRAEHGHQPPQPRPRVLARGRSPRRVRAGRRPPHTLCPAVVTDADGRLRAVLGTRAATPSRRSCCRCWPACCATGQSPGQAIGAPRWVLAGTGHGLRHLDGARGRGRDRGPRPGGVGRRPGRRGHAVQRAEPFDHRFGHANLIALGPDGVRAGAADPTLHRGHPRLLTTIEPLYDTSRRENARRAVANAGRGRLYTTFTNRWSAGGYRSSMRVDTNFFCTVPMPDAGDPLGRADVAALRQRPT